MIFVSDSVGWLERIRNELNWMTGSWTKVYTIDINIKLSISMVYTELIDTLAFVKWFRSCWHADRKSISIETLQLCSRISGFVISNQEHVCQLLMQHIMKTFQSSITSVGLDIMQSIAGRSRRDEFHSLKQTWYNRVRDSRSDSICDILIILRLMM